MAYFCHNNSWFECEKLWKEKFSSRKLKNVDPLPNFKKYQFLNLRYSRGDCLQLCFDQLNTHILELLLYSWRSAERIWPLTITPWIWLSLWKCTLKPFLLWKSLCGCWILSIALITPHCTKYTESLLHFQIAITQLLEELQSFLECHWKGNCLNVL